MHGVGSRAGLLPVESESAVARGQKLRARRLRHNIKSVRALADKVPGIDRGTITRAEAGTASADTYDRLEAWFDQYEEATGEDDYEPREIQVTFRNVFGIGEIIYKGSPEDFPEVEVYIERLVQRERERDAGE